MNRIRGQGSALLLLMASIAAPVAADTEYTDNLPISLLDAMGSYGPDDSRMRYYADIVDTFPAFDLPEEFSVIGSYADGPHSANVVLSTDLAAEPALEVIRETFIRNNWVFYTQSESSGRPLLSYQPESHRILRADACHPDLRPIHFAAQSNPQQTVIRLIHSTSGPLRTCDVVMARLESQIAEPDLAMALPQYMPQLMLPAEIRDLRYGNIRGGGSGMERHYTQMDRIFMVDWSLDQLHASFVEQMREQGWAEEGLWQGNHVHGGVWVRSPEPNLRLMTILYLMQQQDLTYRLQVYVGRMF